MALLGKLFGDANARTLKQLQPQVDQINQHQEEVSKLGDEALASRIQALRQEVGGDVEKLDPILPEVFAIVREASRRQIGLEHFDVQLLGGIALHNGSVAEMRTGEGKTLVATAPVALNALTGLGVHVVTVNDYLARRDAGWMGQVYHALGLSLGIIVHEQAFLYDPDFTDPNALEERTKHLRPVERREAYQADITYGTNNEFGFDYLRDNMAPDKRYLVQRPFHYTIIDEVDSILVDEARTPLIISAPAEASSDRYGRFTQIVNQLDEGDYSIDEKMRAATLTEQGIAKAEKILGIENIYTADGIETVHHLEQALKAKALFQKDKDYVVKEGEVVIVDEFTGRLMFGRRYSEGLHQAIEAKEGLAIKQESRTLATISLQNLFRQYPKMAGMTGTAATEAEELHKIYNLDVVVVPTNKPMVRKDLPDSVYKNQQGKFLAIIREIKRRTEGGQPVLVGTISIEKNELLSQLLDREGIAHETLNAKNHEREAQIVADAGKPGAVTLATNIAGRGVDIKLGGSEATEAEMEKVRDAGGLHVLGTERHESRRIDNQLRGRSGRQGDPGSSQFFVSMEDDLMRIFGSDRMKNMMDRLGIPDDQPIESGMVSKAIEQSQKKVEGHNFDIRKHLVEYDDVMNKHREVIYKRRSEILQAEAEAVIKRAEEVVEKEITQVVSFHTAAEAEKTWDLDAIYNAVEAMGLVGLKGRLTLEDLRDEAGDPAQDAAARTKITDFLQEQADKKLEELAKREESQITFPDVSRSVMLRTIDQLWLEHLDLMERLREGIGLRGYAQKDPLVEYKKEAFDLFNQLINAINSQIANTILRINISPADHVHQHQPQQMKYSAPQKEAVESRQAGGAFTQKPTTVGGVDISKVGRNDRCPCGSGKKFKKCYLANSPDCKLLQQAS